MELNDTTALRDDDTEAMTLADMLVRPDQLANYRRAGLKVDHFYHGLHRILWRAIESLEAEGRDPDPPNLRAELKKRSQWDDGVAEYLFTTLPGLGVPRQRENNIAAHIQRLDQLARCRQAIALVQIHANRLIERPADIDGSFMLGLSESLTSELNPATSPTSFFKTAPQLIAEAPVAVPWVARPFVAQGGITELTGKAKAAGKTSLLLHLVGCVLEAQPFLGEPTRQGPVVYLTEEAGTTFRQGLRRASLDDAKNLHVLSCWDVPGKPWPLIVDLAARKIEETGAAILVMDTLGPFAGLRGDAENNAGDALQVLQPLQRLVARTPVGAIIVRHERKGGGEVGEAGRGSTAFAGGVDIVLSLRRPEGQTRHSIRVIHALSRFTETPETLAIERMLSAAPRKGVPAEEVCATYVPLGPEASVATREAETLLVADLPGEEAYAVKLDEFLDQHPDLKRTTAQEALHDLEASERIRRVGQGKRGDPYRYYRPDKPG